MKEALKKAQIGHKTFFDRSAVTPKASVGSQVHVKLHVTIGPNYEVSPKFIGPYHIHKIVPQNKYVVIRMNDLEKWVVHSNHMKITASDPWSRTELECVDNQGMQVVPICLVIIKRL